MASNSVQYLPRTSRLLTAFAAAALSLTVVACGGVGYEGTLVYEDPPPPRVVVRPAVPTAGYVWVDGYWTWNRGSWAWRNGYWTAPRVGYVHVQPRWAREGRGWRQQEGGWRTRSTVRVNSHSRRAPPPRGSVPVNPGSGGTVRGGGTVRVR